VEFGGGFKETEEAGRRGRVYAGVVVLDRKFIAEIDRLLQVSVFVVPEEDICVALRVDAGVVVWDRRPMIETDRLLPAGFFTVAEEDVRVTWFCFKL
jgi:hypothetical protein